MRLAKATKATLPVGGTSLKLANIMGPQNKTHFCKKMRTLDNFGNMLHALGHHANLRNFLTVNWRVIDR